MARAALLLEDGATDVGDHLGHVVEGERVVTHLFACDAPRLRRLALVGDRGPRAPQQERITVDEVVLDPRRRGDRRARPGCPTASGSSRATCRPGDLLPVDDDDPRLVPTYSYGDDPLDSDDKAQIRAVAKDLGLGRVRTLVPDGRELAAQRWYDGDGGPGRRSPARPRTTARPVASWSDRRPASEMFGVCANGDANDDGRVVSFDHGCGAHSEVRLAQEARAAAPPPVTPVVRTRRRRRGRAC